MRGRFPDTWHRLRAQALLRRGALATSLLLSLGTSVLAHAADDHESHHPGPAIAPDAGVMGSMRPEQMMGAPPPGTSSTEAKSSMPGGMMEGMGEMMRGMGAPRDKPLFPSLMTLPTLSDREREELARRAAVRVDQAEDRLSSALEALKQAIRGANLAQRRQAARDVRAALAHWDSGVALQQALSQGQAPKQIGLDWFRREMNLVPSDAASVPHGFFGLSSVHYLAMAVTFAFAAVSGYALWTRQRRALAIALQLASTPVVVAPARSPASPVGGWSGSLRVAQIFQETADVKTYRLTPLAGDDLPFPFEPGQFLTVSAPIQGKSVRRSYSIASSPACRGWCEITVKKAPGGAVSGYLHESVRVGDVLDAAGPYGHFTFRGREASSVVMIAGGVGITPLMGSIRYLTDQSWSGDIYLVYACASRSAAIFYEELTFLAKRHPNLHFTLVLSRETDPGWTGARGHITAALLKSVVPEIETKRVHLCGPTAMMDTVRGELTTLGLPDAQLFTEQFAGAEPRARTSVEPLGDSVQCRFARSGKTVPLQPEQTVLDAAEAADISLDYSCRLGFCGVCKAKLLEGEASMATEDGLSAADKSAGFILTCQAKSKRDLVVDA